MLALLWQTCLQLGSDHGLHLQVLMAEARASGCQQDSGGGGCLHNHLLREAWRAEMLCQCSKTCRAEVLIVPLSPYSGRPGLWDVLS